MCGISGIINYNSKPNPVTIHRMNDEIKYRGPDHSAVRSNSFFAIGIVRLSIIDLSDKSNQPFIDQAYGLTIIFNGEIYNFKELKNKYFPDIYLFFNSLKL